MGGILASRLLGFFRELGCRASGGLERDDGRVLCGFHAARFPKLPRRGSLAQRHVYPGFRQIFRPRGARTKAGTFSRR